MFLPIFVSFVAHAIRFSACDEHVARYLTKQSAFVNGSLKGPTKIFGDGVTMEFYNTQRLLLKDNYKNTALFSIFNTTYIVVDTDIYFLNDNYEAHPLQTLEQMENPVAFATEYNNFAVAIFTHSSSLEIYGRLRNETYFTFFHSLAVKSCNDINYFVQDDALYMILASTPGTETGTLACHGTCVFRWNDAHFDKIQEIAELKAVAVTSFPSNDGRIVVVLQEASSFVYVFSEKLRKIQSLKTNNPSQALSYEFENERYILILDDQLYKTYRWNGAEVLFLKASQCLGIENIYLSQINDVPVLFATKQTQLILYKPASTGRFSQNITMDLHRNYTQISKIVPITQNEEYALLIFELDPPSAMVLPFSLHFNRTTVDQQAEEGGHDLLRCMKNLGHALEHYDETDVEKKDKYKYVVGKAAQLKKTGAAIGKQYVVGAAPLLTKTEARLKDLRNFLEQLRANATLVQSNIQDSVLGNATIKGSLITETLIAGSLENVQSINNLTWNPASWLSYNGRQVVTGPTFANTVVVKNLKTSSRDPAFKNLLLRNGSQILSGRNTFETFTASKIHCEAINGIPFKNIYLRSQNGKIKGTKIFDSVQTDNATVQVLNNKAPYEILNGLTDPKLYHFKFGSSLNIMNLTFKELNGVKWEEFSNSVFRIGKSSKIVGNLKINQFKVDHLKAKTIDGVPANDLFTTTTNQRISSIMHFRNVDITENFDCNNVNGVDLANNAAAFDPSNVTTIHGPVSMRNLKAYEKLYIDSSKPAFTSNLSQEKDTVQIYHKKVKITGNVVVYDISFDALTEVIVNGEPFQMSTLQNYWLKNEFQKIPVHITFQNGASVPHLMVSNLNGVDIVDYLIQNVNNAKPASFHFENVTVFGNVFLEPGKIHNPNLKAIEANSVKYSGRYTIKGMHRFEGVVTVKNLHTSVLDGIDLSKVVTKNSNVKITGRKNFETLVVAHDVEANSGIINSINRKNLKLLQIEALYVDEETSLPHVEFEKLTVENLRIENLNGKPLNELTIHRNRKRPNNTIASIKFLGNVTINNAKIGSINGVPVKQLVSRMLNDTLVVTHDIHFNGTIYANNLQVATINNVNMNRISKTLFYRNYEQTVLAPFTFNNIQAEKLYADKINNISLNHFIDHDAITQENLNLSNVKYIKTLRANKMLCDIEKAVKFLENPNMAKWKSVEIRGDLKVLNPNSELLHFLNNLVTKNSNNIISANVTLEGHVYANTVTTTGIIDGVNVTKIAYDAIYNSVKGKQIVVTGKNIFHFLQASDVRVRGNAEIPMVNNISVAKVNASIFPRNAQDKYYIRGKKNFYGGLQTKQFNAKHISGVNPESLVNLKNLKVIPKATFDRLVVGGNLTVAKVNDLDFEWFLKNRVLCNSETLQTLHGIYHFERLVLNNDVKTPHLNNLVTKEIVVDTGFQSIESEKTFSNEVSTRGNIAVERINDLDLRRFYENSVMTQQDETINGSIEIKSNSLVYSNLNAETLNGVPVEYLKQVLDFHNPEIIAASAGSTLQKIGDIVDKSLKNLRFLPDKYMYIQEITSFRAVMPPSHDSRVIQLTENSSLILIDGQLSGTFCGLPSQCPCPVEHSVYFGPGTVTINNNTNHRIFKYNEGDMFVSINSKAISVNSYCKTNNSKIFHEYSQLSWKNSRTNAKGSRKILGYLSDAEFFIYDGRVYAVYCEYYDPVLDSHELFCSVMRSNRENSDMKQIQAIPVKGAWKMHILYTVQGIVLIIGNVIPGVSNYTDIYRFNTSNQKFDFLRAVKTIGCTSVAGVVLESNSLIVLAQPETPVHILKYDSSFDNYYYYQSFSMSNPVISVSVFYTGGFGISDAYLCVVMANGNFNLYSFKEIEGWRLESSGGFQGIMDLIPIEMNKMWYLFAPSSTQTKLLAVVKQSYV